MYWCVFVCVCVCVRERERENACMLSLKYVCVCARVCEREREFMMMMLLFKLSSLIFNIYKVRNSVCVCVCAQVRVCCPLSVCGGGVRKRESVPKRNKLASDFIVMLCYKNNS